MAVHDKIHRLLGLESTPGAEHWKKFWSTRLSMLSGGCEAASHYWARVPAEWHEHLPVWTGSGLMYAGLAAALLIPFATVTQQPALYKGNTDENQV